MVRRGGLGVVVSLVLLALLPAAHARGADELLVGDPSGPGSRVVDLNDNELQPGIADLHFPTWSPDGTRIVGTVVSDVVAMDPDGSNRAVLASGWQGPVFSPDGRRWVGYRLNSGHFEMGIGAVAGGTVQPVPNVPPGLTTLGSAATLAWSSADEIAFVFLSNPQGEAFGTHEVGLINPDGSGFRSVLTLPKPPKPRLDDSTYDQALELAFSPDGATLAVGRTLSLGRPGSDPGEPFHYDFRITTVAVGPGGSATDRSVGSDENFGTFTPTGVVPHGLSFAPDGERMAVAGGPDGDNTRIMIYRPADGSLVPIGARTSLKVHWRPAVDDIDGDGLPDLWETAGVDTNGDGTTDLDLPAMGADPRHKDVFVELDFMAPHEYDPAAVDLVVDAFARAPVANPDGNDGVTLHVDNGPSSIMDPATGATWGPRSRHDAVTHRTILGTVAGSEYNWDAFDQIKAAHFEPQRAPAFHYALSAHGHNGTATGIARGEPSDDLLITLGAGCTQLQGADCTMSVPEQAGTLMHELGHTLGLRHGGDDDVAYKPSYLSVMNYAYQLTGLWHTDSTTGFDYARFGLAMDERSLDETGGFRAPASSPLAHFLAGRLCPGGGAQFVMEITAAPVDWNCDGHLSPAPVAADTNVDGVTTVFNAVTDWQKLIFDGGAIGDLGANVPAPPATTPTGEPPLEELLKSKQAFADYVAAHAPHPGPPAGGPTTPVSTPTPVPAGAPQLTALSIRPGRFHAAPKGATVTRKAGATVSFRLSSAGHVRFQIERLGPGRRRGGRCVAQRDAPRGKRCTRTRLQPRTFAWAGRAGANRFHFTGRLARRALDPGRYALVATPLAPDGRPGTKRRANFRVF